MNKYLITEDVGYDGLCFRCVVFAPTKTIACEIAAAIFAPTYPSYEAHDLEKMHNDVFGMFNESCVSDDNYGAADE